MPGVVVRGVRAHGQTTTRAAYALLLLVLSMPENWRRASSVRGPFGSVSAEDAKSVTRAACGISVDWWGHERATTRTEEERNEVRIFLIERGAQPARTPRSGDRRGGSRFSVHLHFRSFPSLDRSPGRESIRLVGDRRDRGTDGARNHDRRDVSDRSHPPGDHRPSRGDLTAARGWPVPPGSRNRREPQRTH